MTFRRCAAFALALLAAPAFAGQSPAGHATSGAYNLALGVGCEHCHTEGNFASSSKPSFDFARRMGRMVDGLNAGALTWTGGISCWTCHRGRAIPARLSRQAWEPLATSHAGAFSDASRSNALTMAVYAASLGVDCAHCHVPGQWSDRSKAAHRTAEGMAAMFDLIPSYFDAAVRMPRTQCYMCHQGSIRVP